MEMEKKQELLEFTYRKHWSTLEIQSTNSPQDAQYFVFINFNAVPSFRASTMTAILTSMVSTWDPSTRLLISDSFFVELFFEFLIVEIIPYPYSCLNVAVLAMFSMELVLEVQFIMLKVNFVSQGDTFLRQGNL